MKCAHKNCNEPRLDVSRFCNLHYDEARAVATGHGYDGVPNVTVFAETPEGLAETLAHYRAKGYVEIQNRLGRRVGEGIEMRYVRHSPAGQTCNINGCDNEASKDISRLGKTALCERHLAIKTDQNMVKARNKTEECEHPGCSYLRALFQRYCPAHMLHSSADAQLQSDIQAMQQRRSPLLDELVAKAVATGAFSPDAQQGNKRADRNDFSAAQRMQGAAREGISGLLEFAAPRRDGKLLELTHEQYHSMIADIMHVTSPFNPSRFGDLQALLKSYGIIGGAK